jgi:osmotically-inducible protein OsmY
MKISRTAVIIGTLTISGAWMGGVALSQARADNTTKATEAKKDRIDDRAAKNKDAIDDKTTVEKARLDDKAAMDKARVDDQAMAKKNELDRQNNAQATAKDTSTSRDTSKEKKDSAGDDVTDAWITAKVKASFVGDKALNHSDIHVDTDHKGILVLSGYVPNETARVHAVAVARETKGVKRVDDKLEIKSTTTK